MKKRNDIILIGSIVAVAVVASVIIAAFARLGETVVVKQDNKIIYSGDLTRDAEVELENNTVVILNGEVKMKNADCKNQICVHHKKISKTGETIVCLPNRVVVEIK